MTQDSDITKVCSFGAEIILGHLNTLEGEIEGVRLAEDIESIHHMRVASRRLRNALELFANCFPKNKITVWQNNLKKVTRSLSLARDTDVQLELLDQILVQLPEKRYRPGIRRIQIRLKQRRQKLQRKILQALDELEKSQTIAQMRKRLEIFVGQPPEKSGYSYELYRLAQQAITEKLENMLAYEPYIYDPNRVEELHAMRISAKKLRYTLETFSLLYSSKLNKPIQATRQMQEILGIIHDCDVWIAEMPKFIEQERKRTLLYYGYLQPFNPLMPGLQYFLTNRQETRQQEYQRFLSEWEKWKKTSLWEKLRQTVTQPTINFAEIYPPPVETPRSDPLNNLDSDAVNDLV